MSSVVKLALSAPARTSLRTAFGGLALLAGLGLAGCETDDPCARRTAACIDVVLIGKKDDGRGNPIAYRGLTVKVYAPNPGRTPEPDDKFCEGQPDLTKAQPYGTELGPAGTELAASAPLELTAAASYSPNIQGMVTFKLPDSFNNLPDDEPDPIIDALSTTKEKVAKLRELRDKDPRSVRIIITQPGQQKSVWDSRCDEALFDTNPDQWLMWKYYRVGKNEYRGVFAPLAGGTPTPL